MPILKNYPIQYIHEPWMAPEQVQRAAKCIVGIDYPKPIIDQEISAKQNQERMRQVYQQLSTYRSIKTPEDVSAVTNSAENEQNQTYVAPSSNKYSTSNLSMQQRKEQQQLMPAPRFVAFD